MTIAFLYLISIVILSTCIYKLYKNQKTMFSKLQLLLSILLMILLIGPILTYILVSIGVEIGKIGKIGEIAGIIPTTGDDSSWIGFYGNFSGGIIGGIVAYLVTRLQISAQSKSDEEKDLKAELPALQLIRMEMDNMTAYFKYIDSLIKNLSIVNGKDYDINFNESESTFNIPRTVIDNIPKFVPLPSIKDKAWDGTEKIRNADLQAEVISCFAVYEELYRVIGWYQANPESAYERLLIVLELHKRHNYAKKAEKLYDKIKDEVNQHPVNKSESKS